MLARTAIAALLLSNVLAVADLVRNGREPLPPFPARPRYLNPLGVAVDPTGSCAFVALSGSNEVAVVDIAAGRIVRRIPTGQRPRAVVYHLGSLYVADNHADVLVIPAGEQSGRRVPRDSLPGGVRDAVLAHLPPWLLPTPPVDPPDLSVAPAAFQGVHAPVRHESFDELRKNGPFQNVLVVGERGFGPNSGAAILGGIGFGGGNNQTGLSFGGGWGAVLPPQLAGLNQMGFAIPLDVGRDRVALPGAAIAHGPAGTIFVSAMGSDCVVQLDAARTASFVSEQGVSAQRLVDGSGALAASLRSSEIMDPAFVGPPQPPAYMAGRLATQSAPGPMAVSADGRVLVVANVLADSLTVVECRPVPRVVKHVALGGPPPDAARRGEILFHSARLDANGRFTCASCHPGGGRDGITWHMPGGEADGRVTKDLHGVRDTAPYGWRGEDATSAMHLRKTLTTLFRHEPTSGEIADLVAYLESLPPTEPAALDPAAAAAAEDGRRLFEGKAGCFRCHPAPIYGDGSRHDVGTGGTFDTPSLRGLKSRANLLHDGDANSVENVVSRSNLWRPHGKTIDLSEREKANLVAFLKSL
jgi:YVTN family beta-propeller protein